MANFNSRNLTHKICITAVLTALNIALSSFGIPVPGGHIYLNDIIIVFAAVLLDPMSAFIVGGLGAFVGDVIFYPAPMFVSLVTHGLQAVVVSLFSHYVLQSRPKAGAIIGCVIGAIIMIVGYSLGRAYIYSTPEYALIKLPFQILQAAVGVIVGAPLSFRMGKLRIFSDLNQRNGTTTKEHDK